MVQLAAVLRTRSEAVDALVIRLPEHRLARRLLGLGAIRGAVERNGLRRYLDFTHWSREPATLTDSDAPALDHFSQWR
jgi:hypothetical protein